MLNGEKFIDLYIDWLKSKISFKEVNGFTEITTPFLDRHNDHLQIYIKQTDNKIFLSDGGYIINDLEMCGCNIKTKKRINILDSIVQGLGISRNDDELCTEATTINFAQKKHSLLQAMLSINDMFMLSEHKVANMFIEDVENFLMANEIRYVPGTSYTGKSGLSHVFDFIIPAFKEQPERIIQITNHLTEDRVKNILFSWDDVCKIRETKIKNKANMYVFINDTNKKVKPEVLNALQEYQVKPVLWSSREKYIEELSA